MGRSQKQNEKTTIDSPQLPYLLGELPIDDGSDAPRGGINPYSPMFDKIGQQFIQFFIDHARLVPNSKTLEIGCGTGRIAKALNGFLNKNKYTGFDNNNRFIEYCLEAYPKSFNFDHYDIQHDEYNPDGHISAKNFEFPYDDGTFDFVCAIAVFNHFKYEWAINYIHQISRVLKPQGIFFGTFILLNQRSMESIEGREEHPFKFDRRDHDSWYEYHNRPLWNVALPEMPIRRSFVNNKMMIKEPIRYGEWQGSPAAITGHDIIVAIKGQWK